MPIKTLISAVVTCSLVSAAGAACTSAPTYAFNGLIRIAYPGGGGNASLVQLCDASAQRLKDAVYTEAARKNIPVKWVEIYHAQAWGSTFHDLIYKTRSFGYNQADYQKYSAYTGPSSKDSSTVVYANRAGKYIAMYMHDTGPSSNRSTDFVVYGN